MMIKMLAQRCMVLFAIFLCYVEVKAEKEEGTVDCEGMMSKKRAMIGGPIHGIGCDGSRGDSDCVKLRNFVEKQRHLPYLLYPKSKLWITLFNDDLQRDTGYDGYSPSYDIRHKKRRHGEPEEQYEGRRIPLLESFWSELENSDSDY